MIIEKQGAMATDRLEELRAAGKVRRYDCNPLVEVFETEEGVYSIYQKSPGIGGDAWMHLVVGEEKAMLTVEKLLGLFYRASGSEFTNDRAILS